MSMQLIDPSYRTPPGCRIFVRPFWQIAIFKHEVKSVGERAVIGLERSGSEFSRFETSCFSEDHPKFEANYQYVERIVKFLLWQRGGHTVYFGGPRKIAELSADRCIQQMAQENLIINLWANRFTKRNFLSLPVMWMKYPLRARRENCLVAICMGHRIGFDLGASDRKVSAVVDGTPIYSEEVIWEPRKEFRSRNITTAKS